VSGDVSFVGRSDDGFYHSLTALCCMLLNNSVKYKYLMRPGNGGHTVIPVPQIGKLPHTINYQSIYLSIHLFYAGTIISNNLPHSVGIPKNDKAKFKATYTTILHGR